MINGGKKTRTKSVTILYEGEYSPPSKIVAGNSKLSVKPESLGVFNWLNAEGLVGDVTLSWGNPMQTATPVGHSYGNIYSNGALLELWQPGTIDMNVEAMMTPKIGSALARQFVAKETVTLANAGSGYSVPIPKGAMFGTQRFTLALAESGGVTKLTYGDTPDVNGAFGGVSTVLDALQGPSAREQADLAQAEADLIFQTQRAALCQADPTNCPK